MGRRETKTEVTRRFVVADASGNRFSATERSTFMREQMADSSWSAWLKTGAALYCGTRRLLVLEAGGLMFSDDPESRLTEASPP